MPDIPLIPSAINLTEVAAEMAIKAMENDGLNKLESYLRIIVTGGGCSGLQYLLDFTDAPDEEADQTFEQHGVKVAIDYFSAAHLIGTTVDYIDGLGGTGFKFDNPGATRKCGCGQSFS